MKSFTKLALAGAIFSASLTAAPVMAEGALSANVGLSSEYYFRGIQQTESASASAGLDYENGGFYIGTWAADVEDGLEIDGYLGYGIETESGIGISLGFTTYQYTGDFDSEYNEVNLNLSYGIFSLEYSVGTQDEDDSLGITETDYDYTALTIEKNGFYGKYATFGDEADGDYFEFGYGTEVGGFDVGVAAIFNDEDLGGGDEDEALVLSIGKSFDL